MPSKMAGVIGIRYYVSRPLIVGNKEGQRIPAAQIEQLVIGRLRQLLADPTFVLGHALSASSNLARLAEINKRAAQLASAWPEMSWSRHRSVLHRLVARIDLHAERIDIQLARSRLAHLLGGAPEAAVADLPEAAAGTTVSIDARLQRVGWGGKMIVGDQNPFARTKPDPAMVKLLIRAHELKRKLLEGGWDSLTQLARAEGLNDSYATRLLRLAYLAPSIVETILDGMQPPQLSAIQLMRGAPLPMDWQEQRVRLGYVNYQA